MPPSLPAFLGRPTVDEPAPAVGTLVQTDLTAGVPAVITLDADRRLVLAVPLGVAAAVLAADPTAVVLDTADPASAPAPDAGRDPAAPIARLTLVSGGRIGGTAPVTAGVAHRLDGDAAGAVEVVVERLRLTAGTLRGAGAFGSSIRLRWRDLRVAPDTGPPVPARDPALTLVSP